MAQADVALHARPAQVQVAVLEADVLVRRRLVLDRERRRARLGQDADLARQHLDLAGRDLGVDRVLGALRDLADHGQHVLAADVVGGGVRRGRDLGARHHLADALAVAEVDEDHAAQVAPRGRPSHDHHRLADVVDAQRAAVVRPLQVPKALSQRCSP